MVFYPIILNFRRIAISDEKHPNSFQIFILSRISFVPYIAIPLFVWYSLIKIIVHLIQALSLPWNSFLLHYYDFPPIYFDKIIKTCRCVPRLWYQKTKTAYRACSALFLFAFYGKLCYSMYVVTPIWHQKGGDFDGIHNYHFSGGHGTSDWSLRVQVVRPPASRQLAQNKNPRNGPPRIFCDFNGHNYRFSG